MRSFTVTLKSGEDGCVSQSRVHIPDDEWAVLIAFADSADTLRNAKIFKSDCRVRLVVKSDDPSSLKVGGTLPDDDDIAALLHRVRPLVLMKEPYNFLHVCDILGKRITDPRLRRVVKKQRDEFVGNSFQEQVRIVTTAPSLTGTLNSDKSFQLWLNAFEYHRDADKKAAIETMSGILGFEAVRAIFVSMLIDKVRAIWKVARLIRNCQTADGTRCIM